MSRTSARARRQTPLARNPPRTRQEPSQDTDASRATMMRRVLVRVRCGAAALMLCCAVRAEAQEPPFDPHAVQPERPTVATHAGTVAPGWSEIEAGIERDRYADGSHGG